MEYYFNIRYEFDKQKIWQIIDDTIALSHAGYICVADGNVVSNVQSSKKYAKIIDDALFTICDSSWIPLYLRLIYGIRREQYCGPMIFKDLIQQGKYRMFFMGTNQRTLNALKKELIKLNPNIANMSFYELPFKDVDEFDYPLIANMIKEDGADIIWIALGAPKQDFFMNKLKPYLNKGIMLGVGAAFNFYSGIGEKRAPQWIINCHLEFLYRIKQAPKKQIKRCWLIIKNTPRLLWQEYIRKQKASKNKQN